MSWSHVQMNDDLRQDDIGVSAMSKYKNVRFVLVLFERHLDHDWTPITLDKQDFEGKY